MKDKIYSAGQSFVCLIWFFKSRQHSFSYVGMGLPGVNQYYSRINVSCSRTQRSIVGEARTRGPFGLQSSTLPLSHCAPEAGQRLMSLLASDDCIGVFKNSKS